MGYSPGHHVTRLLPLALLHRNSAIFQMTSKESEHLLHIRCRCHLTGLWSGRLVEDAGLGGARTWVCFCHLEGNPQSPLCVPGGDASVHC